MLIIVDKSTNKTGAVSMKFREFMNTASQIKTSADKKSEKRRSG